MRRWVLVLGLLLLVAGLTVAPAAAVTPTAPSPPPSVTLTPSFPPPAAVPELVEPSTDPSSGASSSATRPVVAIEPREGRSEACTTLTLDITVRDGRQDGALVVEVAYELPPVAGSGDAPQVVRFPVRDVTGGWVDDADGGFFRFTARYTSPGAREDKITASWTQGGERVATDFAARTWVRSPPPETSVVLRQSSQISAVGSELELTAVVTGGSPCGRFTLLVGGENRTPEPVDGQYVLRYTREKPGKEPVEAVWTESEPDRTVSDPQTHTWTPLPRVTLTQDPPTSTTGARVDLTAVVTDGLPGGTLTVSVTGTRTATLPVQVDGTTFTTGYDGTLPGTDTITAIWTQPGTAPASDEVTHRWVPPEERLQLDVKETVADLGGTVQLTARDTAWTPPRDDVEPPPTVRIRFKVTGANEQELFADLVRGEAVVTYTGTGTGQPTDTVRAFLPRLEQQDLPSNPITVTWRTPTVTLTHDTGSSAIGQEHTVTATVAGAVGGTITFAVAGPNSDVPTVQDGNPPAVTLRYRGVKPGTDKITASLALGTGKFASAELPVDWTAPTVVLDQATAVSQTGQDLLLSATVSPGPARGAVVFTAVGVDGPVTLRDDTPDDGFTATLRRTGTGTDTLSATWEDAGAKVTSAEIRHEWRPEPQPTLVVTPGGTSTCVGNPFTVTVNAHDGTAPAAALPVQVAVTPAGGAERLFTGGTDGAGAMVLTYASATPEAAVETVTATATIGGVAVTSAPATHTWQDCALDVAVDPGSSTSTVGSPVSPIVTVRDVAGRPVPDAAITLRITMAGQDDVIADLITDANGLATTQYRRDVPGTDRITAVVTAGERRATATADHVWQLSAIQVSVGPAGTSGVAGSPFTLTVLVTAGDKPVVGATVGLFVVMSGQDDLGGAPGKTDANGTFSFTYTRPVAGDDTVDVLVLASGQVARASTRHHWTLAPVLRLALEPGGTSGDVGTDFTATATVTVDGGPRGGADVVFVAGPPDRPGRPRTITTDAAGRAAFTYRGTEAGTHTITAKVAVSGFPEGSASINRVWRAAGVVRSPDRRADVRITPRTGDTPAPPPSPGSGAPAPSPQPAPQPDPQGPAVVEGTRCPPGSTVTLTVGGVALGTVTADADGNFALPVRMPDLAVGRHQLVASCPPVRVEREVDIVHRTSSTGTGAASASTAVAVLSFFVLLGGQLVRLRSWS